MTSPPRKKRKLNTENDTPYDTQQVIPYTIKSSLSSDIKAEIVSYLPLDEIYDIHEAADIDPTLSELKTICENASKSHPILLCISRYRRDAPQFTYNQDLGCEQIVISANDIFQHNFATDMIRKYWKQIRYLYFGTRKQNDLNNFMKTFNASLRFVKLLSFQLDIPSAVSHDMSYLSNGTNLELIHIPFFSVEAWNVIVTSLPNLHYLNLNMHKYQIDKQDKEMALNMAENLWSLSLTKTKINHFMYETIQKLLAASPNLYHYYFGYYCSDDLIINYSDIKMSTNNNTISLSLDRGFSYNCNNDNKLCFDIINQYKHLQYLSVPLILHSKQGIIWTLQMISFFVNKNFNVNNKYLRLIWQFDKIHSDIPQQFVNNIHYGDDIEQRVESIYEQFRNSLINEYQWNQENMKNCTIAIRKKGENDRTKRIDFSVKFVEKVLGISHENIHYTDGGTFISLTETTNLLQDNKEFREFSKQSQSLPTYFFACM